MNYMFFLLASKSYKATTQNEPNPVTVIARERKES